MRSNYGKVGPDPNKPPAEGWPTTPLPKDKSMKICFKWQGFVQRSDTVEIIQLHCWFLPIDILKWRSDPTKAPGSDKLERDRLRRKGKKGIYWWSLSEAEDFVETYIYGSFASRNAVDGMPTWDIPDDEIANVVSLFCVAGADVSLSEELLTIKC